MLLSMLLVGKGFAQSAEPQDNTSSSATPPQFRLPLDHIPKGPSLLRWMLAVRTGMSDVQQSLGDVDQAADDLGYRLDLSAHDQFSTYQLSAGLAISRRVFAEASLMSTGRYSVHARGGTGDDDDQTAARKLAHRLDPVGDAFALGLSAAQPLGRSWLIESRGGLSYVNAERKAVVNGASASLSKQKPGAYLGLSAMYAVTCALHLGVAADQYSAGSSWGIRTLSLQLEYRGLSPWDCAWKR